jgi:hypothetical protein
VPVPWTSPSTRCWPSWVPTSRATHAWGQRCSPRCGS